MLGQLIDLLGLQAESLGQLSSSQQRRTLAHGFTARAATTRLSPSPIPAHSVSGSGVGKGGGGVGTGTR